MVCPLDVEVLRHGALSGGEITTVSDTPTETGISGGQSQAPQLIYTDLSSRATNFFDGDAASNSRAHGNCKKVFQAKTIYDNFLQRAGSARYADFKTDIHNKEVWKSVQLERFRIPRTNRQQTGRRVKESILLCPFGRTTRT